MYAFGNKNPTFQKKKKENKDLSKDTTLESKARIETQVSLTAQPVH